MIVVGVIVVLLVVLIALIYIDSKSNYSEVPIFKWTKDNGEFYFSVPYYIWQKNKKKIAKIIHSQNTILDFDGYKFVITNFGGEFPKTNGDLFFERELRFWGDPLTILQTNKSEYLTINQYGSGIINIELNKSEITNEIIKIQEYISNDAYIDITDTDKEIIQDFLNKALNGKGMDRREAEVAYDTFLKYEPLLSFSVNIMSLIKDLFIK